MVGPHRQLLARRKDHVDLALLRLLFHHHAHFLDQRGQRHRLDRQAQAARFDLRQVEDFIDQRQKMAARSDDVLHEGALLHDSRGQRFVGQQLGKAEDGVERRAQFVRHAGEKAVLGLAGPLQFDFLFVERAFDALALRDVADGRRHQHAFLRFQRRQADFDGELGAVAAQAVQFQAGAHGAGARGGRKALAVMRVVGRVAGGDQHFHVLAQQFGARIAEQALRLRVDQHDLAVAVDDDDGVRRRFEQAAKLLFGAAAVADVADGADDKGADFRLDGRQADFHGEFDVILAQTQQFQVRPHGARARLVEIARAVAHMRMAEALRQQGVDLLAAQFAFRVAEQALRLQVGQHDGARGVDHDDAVGRRFEQHAVARIDELGVAQGLEQGRVLHGGNQVAGAILAHAHALARDVYINELAILAPPQRFVVATALQGQPVFNGLVRRGLSRQ